VQVRQEHALGLVVGVLAMSLGIDSLAFARCTDDSPEVDQQIEKEIRKAKAFGLTGTPAFAIGRISTPGEVDVWKFVSGAQPVEVFRQAIREVLTAQRR
jgi:predicted DsbA family dithiol-disulfide isomerase